MKEKFKKEIEKPSFFFFLLVSFAIHIFLAIFFLTLNNLWSFFRKEKKIVVPASIRVDMVELPDLPSKNEKVKAKKEKPDLLSTKTKEKNQQTKNEKKPRNKEVTKKDNSKQFAPDPKPEINKGNQLAKGIKEAEEELDTQRMEAINIYLTAVIGKIKLNWNLPKYLTDIRLTAQIEIKINDQGIIVYKQIVSTSGNDLFDSRVLKAMENAAPYPSPPAVVRRLIQNGIVFTLNSKD